MRTKKRALALFLALVLALGLLPASALEAGKTYSVTVTGAPAGASIVVVDGAGKVAGTGGSLALQDGNYTCYVGADGYRAAAESFAVDGGAVTVPVTLGAYSESGWTTAETGNMTVLTDAGVVSGVPKTAEEARVAWTASVGGGWTNATTNALFVNGGLYVVGGGALRKINAETGEVTDSYTLAAGNAYNYFITTAEGLVFVQEGLRVEAVDPSTMTQAWVSDALSAGNQGLTPLTYAGGYLYGGTVDTAKAGGDAVLFCLSAADGGVVWQTKAELVGEGPSGYTGFYWAGPAVAGDYVVCGSEGGRVYAVDRFTGEIIDSFDIDGTYENSIRSSVAVDGNYLYFTDKTGCVHKLGFDAGTGEFDDDSHRSARITAGAAESVGTPAVYNGRLYVGSSGASGGEDLPGVGVFDVSGAGLTEIYEIPFAGTKLYDVSLVADGTAVYGYTTYYTQPGGVLGFSDAPDQTEPHYADFGPVMGDASNYCAAMPVLGPDGTIYFANDSGRLVALEKNAAYLTGLTCSVGALDSAFASWDEDYELAAPVGTESVTLGFSLPADASATLNGTPDGGAGTAVTLTDGAAAAEIAVTNDADTRTYTVAIHAVGTDASIRVVVNGSNNITDGSPASLGPYGGSGNRYVVSDVTGSAKNRVWVAASDPNAEIDSFTVTGGYSVASPTSDNEYGGVTYTDRAYFDSLEGSAVVTVHVTAEDGETEATYHIFATTGSGVGAFAYADAIAFGADTLHFAAVGESETLTADCTYFGTSETKETLVWSSSDEAVAAVDQSGVVTAVGEGTATVTASGACASASCAVKVGARVYVTIADGGALVTGADAEHTLLAQAPVTAEDRNENGYIDIDDVLVAAHEAYYPGGAKVGYATYPDPVYGPGIAAFWGVSTTACGYWVNDVSAWSLLDAVEPGDYITAFNYKDTAGWSDVYGYFSAPTASATAGAALTLTLNGYVYDTGAWRYVSSPYAGAAVTVPGTALTGTTGENGRVTLAFPSAGTYYVVALDADAPIVPAVCKVTVRNASSGGDTIRVAFTLLGDSAHGGGEVHTFAAGNLTTWIGRTTVTVPEDATVGDVFKKVLNTKGYSYTGLSQGYISLVTTPEGLTLAEYTNGNLSGWMYTVNGTHPQCGLNDYTLEGGDEIVWHYTDDYTAEEGSGQWSASHGGAEEPEEESETVSVTPRVSNGEARASVGESELAAAAAAARLSGAACVAVVLETGEEVRAARVSVDADALEAVAGERDLSLAVRTPAGNVEFPPEALASLLEQAEGGSVEIIVARKTDAEVAALLESADGLTAEDVADAAVVQISVASGGADITAFGESPLLVSIPVEEGYEEGARYRVIVLSVSGAVEILTGRVVRKDGALVAEVEVEHLSTFFVTRGEVADFLDVPDGAWYYDAAVFARANALMEGDGGGSFVPKAGMTRAMLAVVLYRLAGEPETADAALFSDVADGAWYADAAAWAAESGVVFGYGDGRFGPADAVSRQQVALMLRRYASYRGFDVGATASLDAYGDAGDAASWALPAMRWAAAEGIVGGTDAGELRPGAEASRAEVAVILMRFCRAEGR